MITFLGFLILLAGIAALIISKLDKGEESPKWLSLFTSRQGIIGIAAGIVLMLINPLFFFVDRGFNYLLVSPTGH